jgi:hypothetical protein
MSWSNAKSRVESASWWSVRNAVIPRGGIAVESDTGKVKIGDGRSTWSTLDYVGTDDPAVEATEQRVPRIPEPGTGFTVSGAGAFGSGKVDDTGVITASGVGSFAQGYADGDGAITSSGPGSKATGRAEGGTVRALTKGSFANGFATGAYAGVDGLIDAGGTPGGAPSSRGGNTAFGHANGGIIQADGLGAFAAGQVDSAGSILSSWAGSWAGGAAQYFGEISAIGSSLAFGYTYTPAGKITSSFPGSVAFGWSYGDLVSSGGGSFAQGYVGAGGEVEATAKGTVAVGFASGAGASVSASGQGSLAQGKAGAGEVIAATAANAVQFGVGTNAQADSVSIGTGPRLKGPTGAPGTPRNGDIWVANNYVYVRSNDASVKITYTYLPPP